MESVVALMADALEAAGCTLYARGADKGQTERATYNFNTTTYNGSRREVRLKVQIYAAMMTRGLELEKILDEALVKTGERSLTPTVTACARNGGGWLEDGDGHIRIAYYDLVLRVPRDP